MSWKNKEKEKEYREKNKEKRKKYKKEYYEKNKEKISEKNKEYRKINKDKIKKYKKEYYEKNKEKIKKYVKEYDEKNKNKIKEKQKEAYSKAIKKISDFYGTGVISFFTGKPLQFKYKLKNKLLDFCVIDHIDEKESGKKDKLKGEALYKYVCSEKAKLSNYQLLSSKENFIKERLYSLLNELKETNKLHYKFILNSYNKRFVNNKYRLIKDDNDV